MKKLTKKQLYAQYYNGSIAETVALMKKDGINISRMSATRYNKDNSVIDLMQKKVKPTVVQAAGIANKIDRQTFWTNTMNNSVESMRDRLRASELLGKSEADFTEKIEHSTSDDLGEAIRKARLRLKNAKK